MAVKAKKNLKEKKLMRISNELFRGELESLYELNHPNILQLVSSNLIGYLTQKVVNLDFIEF